MKINEFLLTFFYLGKSKKAPGTVGSLGAVILWFCLAKLFYIQEFSLLWQNIFWSVLLYFAIIYATIAIPIYTAKTNKDIDHGSIVLDEVIGQILPLQFTFSFIHQDYFSDIKTILIHLGFCFISFRILDITKPGVIGFCDRNFKSGFGVIMDDVLCGINIALISGIYFWIR